MKLLFANHQLDRLAGSELHTLDLCRGFRRVGHEVCVFALEPGLVTEQMRQEGFGIYTHRNLLELVEEPPDLIYLHHSTCEVFLGIVFAGRVPIVRGFVSRKGPSATPTNGGFLSGAVFVSEETRDSILPLLDEMPHMLARNVVDEIAFADSVESESSMIGRTSIDVMNFAVVSNHGDAVVFDVLEAGEISGICSSSRFGGDLDERIPITANLLRPFDAVVSLGRTAIAAAALGKPVYVADIHGSDGWLSDESYIDLQRTNFSGRCLAITDRVTIEEQLFDLHNWPDREDLSKVRERVLQDHGLSRRVAELEYFFEQIMRAAPSPIPVSDGYRGVYNFLKRAGRPVGVDLTTLKKRIKEQESENARLRSRIETLERMLDSLESFRTPRLIAVLRNARSWMLRRR